jgi:hypothetical protein
MVTESNDLTCHIGATTMLHKVGPVGFTNEHYRESIGGKVDCAIK